jgi:hypothetical protein
MQTLRMSRSACWLWDEDFPRPDIGRLNERRLAVLEERIDADLRSGRAWIVGALESLVEANPAPGTVGCAAHAGSVLGPADKAWR